ncbi:hypothetical protein AB6A40_009779 [Gnathostoma spinigerum]|uniref:Large ribosomal subunit protein bL32m n=1 Tax=Gnathostoma spinigerum TaxID=75299 RepID=A0ABD6F252_9BILA
MSSRILADGIISFLSRFLRPFGFHRKTPSLCLACVPCIQPFSGELNVNSVLNDFRIVFGVPKSRTSKPKKQARRFAYTRLYSLKDNLVVCQNCGEYHEMHTICGNCYSRVRELTNKIKAKIMEYNPYIGESQDKPIHIQFSDSGKPADEVVNGKRIIEMDIPRPSWFKRTFKAD